jgi:hypothetical protein
MVSELASCVVDRGFEPRSGQTKDYHIGIWCFSAMYTALRSNSKDWLVWNQENVSKLSDMSTRGPGAGNNHRTKWPKPLFYTGAGNNYHTILLKPLYIQEHVTIITRYDQTPLYTGVGNNYNTIIPKPLYIQVRVTIITRYDPNRCCWWKC